MSERPEGKRVENAVSDGVILYGRFEAQFGDVESARTAAREARSVRFEVDVRHESTGRWLIVCRRQLPFSADDRDRYASRIDVIAKQHGGGFSQFVEEADVQPTPTKGRG